MTSESQTASLPLALPQPGDQIRVSTFAPHRAAALPDLGPQTLSVVGAWPGMLTVETADGKSYMLDAPLSMPLALWYGLEVLHPWKVLADAFPGALRLDTAAHGQAIILKVTPDGEYAAGEHDLARFSFLPVGHLTPEGVAKIEPRFDGTVEGALRCAADVVGWEWAVRGSGGGLVTATVCFLHAGQERVVRGRARRGGLALAYAMRLAWEVCQSGEPGRTN